MFAWRALPPRGDASPSGGSVEPGAYLTVPALHRAGIRVAFTTRHGGVSADPYRTLNLSYLSGDEPERVRGNRARVLAALGAAPEAWTNGQQVHDATVRRVTGEERGAGWRDPAGTIPETDALWTDQPGIALSVLTADCLPIVLADPGGRRVAVVHAGWRGLVAGVVDNAVRSMGEAAALMACIGPAIGPCCYEVGAEVATTARDALGPEVVRERADGRVHLDLWRGAAIALRRSGVRDVRPSALCTRCEPHRFYSHRAGDAGRQGLVALIAPGGDGAHANGRRRG